MLTLTGLLTAPMRNKQFMYLLASAHHEFVEISATARLTPILCGPAVVTHYVQRHQQEANKPRHYPDRNQLWSLHRSWQCVWR